ncbi:MAG: hypothetical protein A2Y38_15685 [Spirochaetes bacterium GWB1_59_5]|nr:MAG: hypothetical protein A2Y38_15685 [Spirochaetes bacterium GWB1_59_5]
MNIYVLQAKGSSGTFPGSGKLTFIGKTAYRTPEAAEAEKAGFKARCCAGGLFDPDPETTVVTVVELTLAD